MSDLTTIFLSGGLSALLASALVFLFRNWISERIKGSIQHEYDQKLETHKAKLQAESDISIVKLTKQLEIAASEHSIKLTKVFERQAEVITTTYAKLLLLLNSAEDFTMLMGGSTKEEQLEIAKRFNAAATDFYSFYHPNKIYLPKNTAATIQKLGNTVVLLCKKHSMADKLANSNPTSEAAYKILEKHEAQIKELEDQIPALLKLLEDDFQTILGVRVEDKTVS